MIQIVDNLDAQDLLLKLCEKNAFGCKIAAIALAYGFDKKFACFWISKETSAVYCMADEIMIISGTIQNAAETRAFLSAVGAKQVICAVRNAELLKLTPLQLGDVLKKAILSRASEKIGIKTREVNIRDIYFLLEEVGMADDFEAFYLDLSHKLRHGIAHVETQYRGKELIGCCVVSALTETAAIISALAVKETFRHQGIGTLLLEKAETKLQGKTAYIFTDKNENKAFYRALGYGRADGWITAKID